MISGACVLYQAMLGNDVVSSMTVARSRLGRYLHTSGTSPAGMSVGASHFLIYEIARSAQAEGANRFNLGGARDRDCGLAKFKEHFGAECIELESADFFVGNAVDRVLHSLLGGTRGFLATFARAAKR
jgi:hypothetical protein